MAFWAPFSHDNIAIDLTHLEPIEFRCGVQDMPERNVMAVFGSHTFTRGMEPDDTREHRCFDNRVFCAQRYNLSLQLPQIVLGLPKARVYQTWERNSYVYLATQVETDGGLYHMFFGVQRVAYSKKQKRVEMRVVSAYPREGSAYIPPARPPIIGFPNLIENTYMGRPVKFA